MFSSTLSETRERASLENKEDSHVELRLPLRARRMQRDDLRAEKIVARSDARRQREINPTIVVDHAVHAPLTRAIKTVL
jgi:hypothetical protein